MERINVNGRNIYIKPGKSRYTKTAYQLSQMIYHDLERIGITRAFVELPIPRNPLSLSIPAEISWRVNGQEYYYKASRQERYVDNLGVIWKVINAEVYAIKNGLKEFGVVMNQFRLDYDPKTIQKTPHEILGIDPTITDKEYIKYRYKQLAKLKHPDVGGDPEEFKKIKDAYDKLSGGAE